ncbi:MULTISPECIES: LPXTG cell wall anchor domain-containing protein [Streptococcus]|uniref:LPXTG cell wall anchor domain-containing protein n=1 Tax=Streptococcus TaxID=1301 RepID=UPI000EF6E871|nr:LPXTG cell wall anchor domain-containing protein [Streptococcus iniae]HEP4573330.1 LPXTG cell wall anchor domain-containing protein [Streptococcus pyogenes]RLV20071.1 cell wall anchor protein [Streptococcus iniae]HEP4643520.1 LPXTG cell wall anchor domain-containing protein [Streptococcus pyogenes]HEP4646801.1 LPXTG cell wall anchor domain-containing protein [Streptococcus pyogenes]HEP4648601.1 LPXTG cell wall anchor domain-containing protein [Streptococcus pyogenes]
MTKKQLLVLSCVSTIALAGTTAFAEEVVPVDPTVPSTEVVTPPAPVVPEKLPDTSKPAEPETPKEELPAPVDPTTPSAGKEDKPETVPGQAEMPKEEAKPENPKSSEDKKKEELVPDNVSKDIIDKVDTTTGEVVFKPIPVTPDKTVIGTKDSQVIIRDQAGHTQVVTPESLGGHVNPNGTVTLKDATGAEKTLPKTGDKQSVLGYLGMMLISVLGYAVKKKVSH